MTRHGRAAGSTGRRRGVARGGLWRATLSFPPHRRLYPMAGCFTPTAFRIVASGETARGASGVRAPHGGGADEYLKRIVVASRSIAVVSLTAGRPMPASSRMRWRAFRTAADRTIPIRFRRTASSRCATSARRLRSRPRRSPARSSSTGDSTSSTTCSATARRSATASASAARASAGAATVKVGGKRNWPAWMPPPEMIEREKQARPSSCRRR